MIDGGISNPVPYECLMDRADIVIGIDVVGAPEGDGTHIPNRMESIFGSGQLMMQTAIIVTLRSWRRAYLPCAALRRPHRRAWIS